MLIRGVVKFSARNCPGINFRKVGNYATAKFARQTAALSSSMLADNSDPFTDIEDEGQLETKELVIDDDGDQQD